MAARWLVLAVAAWRGAPQEDNGDVLAYFGPAHRVIEQCSQASQATRRKGSGTCITVTEDGAIVHGRDLHDEPGSGKQMLMDMMLRGVIGELKARGDWRERRVSFLMVYSASGPVRDESFPVLGFGKRDPGSQPGLLVPNPFFVTPRWWTDRAATSLERSAERPWSSRSPRALFRGACGPGAHARFRLLRMLDPEGRLDVGFTNVDGYPALADCVRDLASANDGSPADVERILADRLRPHVPQTNFSFYRYLLHMPGSATGSYSRNLQYLWTHGAVVLIWRHSAAEWYYRHLQDGVHYVAVDETSLYDTLRRLDADPNLQAALRAGSRHFATDHLSGRALVDRWRSVFAVLYKRQAPPAPGLSNASACTCDTHLPSTRHFPPCNKCEITRKRGRTIDKFVGLVPKTRRAAPPPRPMLPGPVRRRPRHLPRRA